jgi:sec-independent protein translocase protein TatB
VFNLGIGEIAVILVVALIFLGPKMLPEIASGVGKVIREIRKATADIRQDIELDDMIRGPLRELRDAATLPPEELKRRDEAKAARLKAEAEAAARRAQEAKAAEEAKRREQEATRVEETKPHEHASEAKLPAPLPVPPAAPTEVISTGGTMISNPPPDSARPSTPMPELPSPAPELARQPPALPAPPPPAPPPPAAPPPLIKITPPSEATVIDLQAQIKAMTDAQGNTIQGRPVLAPARPPLYKPKPERNQGPPSGSDGEGKG